VAAFGPVSDKCPGGLKPTWRTGRDCPLGIVLDNIILFQEFIPPDFRWFKLQIHNIFFCEMGGLPVLSFEKLDVSGWICACPMFICFVWIGGFYFRATCQQGSGCKKDTEGTECAEHGTEGTECRRAGCAGSVVLWIHCIVLLATNFTNWHELRHRREMIFVHSGYFSSGHDIVTVLPGRGWIPLFKYKTEIFGSVCPDTGEYRPSLSKRRNIKN